jgi:type II secretory pathway predicted ATPase ExeA
VEKITAHKEKNTFYYEEVVIVGGYPTERTWSIYKRDKDELKNRGYFVTKKMGDWFFFAVIVPSRYYNELVEIERRNRVVISEHVSDEIKALLKPHQVEVIDYNFNIFKERKLFKDTSDAGTGKTYVSLALIKEMDLIPILVIPAVSIPGWLRALAF